MLVGWPLLRRLATRNTRRRPVEALLVIGGSLLGTAIITGSLIVGDTIDRSIRAAAYDQLGPIDEIVSVPLDRADQVAARFDGFSSPLVDGMLSLTTTGAAVVHPADGRAGPSRARSCSRSTSARRGDFGGDPGATGISGATPAQGRPRSAATSPTSSASASGDEITVFAGGGNTTLTVDRVLPRRGVAGYWTIDGRQQSYNVFVAPGTIAGVAAAASRMPAASRRRRCSRSRTSAASRAARTLSARALAAIDAGARRARRSRPVR